MVSHAPPFVFFVYFSDCAALQLELHNMLSCSCDRNVSVYNITLSKDCLGAVFDGGIGFQVLLSDDKIDNMDVVVFSST